MSRIARAPQDGLDCSGARKANQICYLPNDLTLRGLLAENQPTNAYYKQQQRREGEQRIESQCRAEPGGIVPAPSTEAFAEQALDFAPPKRSERLPVPSRAPRTSRYFGSTRLKYVRLVNGHVVLFSSLSLARSTPPGKQATNSGRSFLGDKPPNASSWLPVWSSTPPPTSSASWVSPVRLAWPVAPAASSAPPIWPSARRRSWRGPLC